MIARKEQEAQDIVRRCLGRKGIYASPYRYQDQCWTRDFVIAGLPYLLLGDRPDYQAVAGLHLHELAKRQKPNGQIPIMFLDNTSRWLRAKIAKSVRQRRISFLLRAFLSKEGVGALSPWTRDSEFLFAIGILQYVAKTHDVRFLQEHRRNINLAMAYAEGHLMKDGIVYGVDWRDTRPDLDDKALLTNNCLLFQAYSLLGNNKAAEDLKQRINNQFWAGQYYRDYPGTQEFDTLGNALAVLLDIAPREHWDLVFTKADELNTPFGYKLNGVTLPTKSPEETAVMLKTNQFGVIWPFIHYFMTRALIRGNNIGLARQQFDVMDQLEGFFEWYDPQTGNGYGSPDQLWSAALYLTTLSELKEFI